VVVLTLALVGVYSIRNSLPDCWVAIGFGLLGYVLRRVNWPLVPIILGMVLGEIIEAKLRTSMARVETPLDFVNRPVSATIAIIIVLALAAHVWTEIRSYRQRRTKTSPAA
jgi:putative tricarboxylic transport membrane protein